MICGLDSAVSASLGLGNRPSFQGPVPWRSVPLTNLLQSQVMHKETLKWKGLRRHAQGVGAACSSTSCKAGCWLRSSKGAT